MALVWLIYSMVLEVSEVPLQVPFSAVGVDHSYPITLLRCIGDLSSWPSNQSCTLSAFRLPLPAKCITSCNFSFLATVMSISLSKCFILPPQHSHLAYRAKSMNQVKGQQVGRESVWDRDQEENREWEVNPPQLSIISYLLQSMVKETQSPFLLRPSQDTCCSFSCSPSLKVIQLMPLHTFVHCCQCLLHCAIYLKTQQIASTCSPFCCHHYAEKSRKINTWTYRPICMW